MNEEIIEELQKHKFISNILSFYLIKTDRTLLIRKIWLICLFAIQVVVSYFIVVYIFGRDNLYNAINMIMTIDLALFALQIATFTLILSPFKNLQKQIGKRKIVYLKEIKEDKSIYDKEILDKLNETIMYNNRKFRFEAFSILFITIAFIVSIIISCINPIPAQVRVSFLFADMVNQFIAFVHFIMMLCSFFFESKQSIDEDIEAEKIYIVNKLKIDYQSHTDKSKYDIAYEVERISREEENNG